MSKRTFASVTEAPCACGWLGRMASNPNVPVKYASEVNEYHLEHVDEHGGKTFAVLYHCPFCGGAAPESKRGDLFSKISDQEAARLRALTDKVKSGADAMRVLGHADDDEPIDIPAGTALRPKRDGTLFRPKRVLTFSQLSDVAEVQVMVDEADEAQVTIAPKMIRQP